MHGQSSHLDKCPEVTENRSQNESNNPRFEITACLDTPKGLVNRAEKHLKDPRLSTDDQLKLINYVMDTVSKANNYDFSSGEKKFLREFVTEGNPYTRGMVRNMLETYASQPDSPVGKVLGEIAKSTPELVEVARMHDNVLGPWTSRSSDVRQPIEENIPTDLAGSGAGNEEWWENKEPNIDPNQAMAALTGGRTIRKLDGSVVEYGGGMFNVEDSELPINEWWKDNTPNWWEVNRPIENYQATADSITQILNWQYRPDMQLPNQSEIVRDRTELPKAERMKNREEDIKRLISINEQVKREKGRTQVNQENIRKYRKTIEKMDEKMEHDIKKYHLYSSVEKDQLEDLKILQVQVVKELLSVYEPGSSDQAGKKWVENMNKKINEGGDSWKA